MLTAVILSKNDAFPVARTSKCDVISKGTIKDGDTIEVVSPIFSSVNFKEKSLKTSSTISVPAKIVSNNNGYVNDPETGRLICEDSDVDSMFVEL